VRIAIAAGGPVLGAVLSAVRTAHCRAERDADVRIATAATKQLSVSPPQLLGQCSELCFALCAVALCAMQLCSSATAAAELCAHRHRQKCTLQRFC
jgi:cob(I)alamin adenosyltransferase